MKILIFGASGTVGRPIFQALSKEHEVYGTYNSNKPEDAQGNFWRNFSVTDTASLEALLDSVKPDLIISSLVGDFEMQLQAHKHMGEYLQKNTGRIIFLSTANVFDGNVRGSHSEKTPSYPMSKYGSFKLECETYLQNKLGDRCLIVRLPKIMDEKTAEAWRTQAKTGTPPVYENLYMSFNTAENVANAIKYCVDIGKSGTLHLTSSNSISISKSMELLGTKATNCQQLTIESYCNIFDCKDYDLLRHSGDNAFKLDLICTDTDISSRFKISCEEVFQP